MAELDLLNYPGSKLGSITSPAPSVLKPTAKQTPLGPQDKGQEYLAQIEPEMEELKKSTLAKSEIDTAQREQQARSLATKQESLSKATTAQREAIEGSAPYKEEKTVQEQLKNAAFVPRQDNAQDLATLFSLINVLGFAIGSGGKGNAMQALSAMDGMAKGYQQGRVDLYKKEKDLFDTSMKTLKTKSDVLSKQVQEIVELAARDKQAAAEKADAVFAQEGADFYREYAKRFGLAALSEYDKQRVTGLTKAFELKTNQENKEKGFKLQEEKMRAEERSRQATLAQQKELAQMRMQQGGGGKQQQFVVQRAVNSLGGVASAVESINRLPAGTTTGVLPNLQTKDGMLNAMRNFAGRKVSPSEEKAMETLFTGITRNLASIEASGSATGLVGLAGQIEKLRPVAGDTAFDVALKMADIRRIAVENTTPLVQSGLMPAQQAQVAQQLIQRIEKAIPYTTEDVVNAIPAKGRKTTGESSTSIGEKGRLSAEKEARLRELEERENAQ
jgi:hypothetical protein